MLQVWVAFGSLLAGTLYSPQVDLSPSRTQLKLNSFNRQFSCFAERGCKPWKSRLPVSLALFSLPFLKAPLRVVAKRRLGKKKAAVQSKAYFSSLLLNHYHHSFTEVRFSVIILGLTCLHLYKLWCRGLFFWFYFSSSNSWTKVILWPKKGQRASQCMWLHGPLASQCLLLPSTCVHIHHHLKTTVCPAASACVSTHLGSLFHLRQHGADVKHFHCLIHHREL